MTSTPSTLVTQKNNRHFTEPGKFVIFCVFFVAIYLSPTLCGQEGQSSTILLDRIAAVVEQQIITLTDIDRAIQFFPVFRNVQQQEEAFFAAVLEDLINYKVVYLEFKNNYEIREEDYVQVQTDAIDKMGSLDAFRAHLKSYQMDLADFKAFVVEKVVYEKVLAEHLQGTLGISFKEIETFYREEYVPQQDQLGLNPRTLVEMASQIESHLRKLGTRRKLANWLRDLRASYHIENKLIHDQTNLKTK